MAKVDRLKRSATNSFFAFTTFFITSLLGLVVTPYVIKKVTPEYFGLFRLILDYKIFIGLCELGLTVSSIKFISEAISKNEKESITHVLKLFSLTSIKILPLTFMGAVIVYFVIPREISIEGWKFNFLYISAIVTIFIYNPLNVFVEFLKADEREDIVTIASFVQLLVMTTLTVILLHLGFGIISLGLAHLAAAVLFALIITSAALNLIRKFPSVPKHSLAIDQKTLWQHNRYAFAQSLSSFLTHSADTIIISYFVGIGPITLFFINNRLPQIAQQLCQSLGGSSWASLVKIYYTGDQQNFLNKFYLTNKTVIFFSFSILSSIYLYNLQFIKVWMGNDFLLSNRFMFYACGTAIVFSINSFWTQIIIGSGHLNELVKGLIVCSVVNITFSILFTKLYGSVGVLMGTFYTTLFLYFGLSIYFLKNFFAVDLKSVILPVLISAVFSPIFIGVHKNLPDVNLENNWFSLVPRMGLTFLTFVIIFFPIIFSTSDRAFIKERVRNILKKSGSKDE